MTADLVHFGHIANSLRNGIECLGPYLPDVLMRYCWTIRWAREHDRWTRGFFVSLSLHSSLARPWTATSLSPRCSSAQGRPCDGSCWRLLCRPKSKFTHWAYIRAHIHQKSKRRHASTSALVRYMNGSLTMLGTFTHTSLHAARRCFTHAHLPACSGWEKDVESAAIPTPAVLKQWKYEINLNMTSA